MLHGMSPHDSQTWAGNVGSFLRSPEALRAARSDDPGHAPGGRWHSCGGYGAVSARLLSQLLEVDRLLLEYDTERAGGQRRF